MRALRSKAVMVWRSPLVQRALPDDVAVRIAASRPTGEELDSAVEAEIYETILAGTPLAGREREVARHATLNGRRADAIMQRPGMVRTGRLVGDGPLRELMASPRGALTATGHLTTSFLRIAALATSIPGGHVVLGDFFLEDRLAARNAARRRVIDELGVPLIGASGSFARVRELLAAGETCHIAFDVAGDHQVDFLGKPTGVRTGAARLAILGDAPVLFGYSVLIGDQVETRFGAPIDPRETGDDPHPILQRLADQLTEAYYEHPELLHPSLVLLWRPELLGVYAG